MEKKTERNKFSWFSVNFARSPVYASSEVDSFRLTNLSLVFHRHGMIWNVHFPLSTVLTSIRISLSSRNNNNEKLTSQLVHGHEVRQQHIDKTVNLFSPIGDYLLAQAQCMSFGPLCLVSCERCLVFACFQAMELYNFLISLLLTNYFLFFLLFSEEVETNKQFHRFSASHAFHWVKLKRFFVENYQLSKDFISHAALMVEMEVSSRISSGINSKADYVSLRWGAKGGKKDIEFISRRFQRQIEKFGKDNSWYRH